KSSYPAPRRRLQSPPMRTLTLKLPHTLWAALEHQHRETGEPIPHIVRAALADHLQTEHQTLFQASTSTALGQGISRGAVTVGQLKEHGDCGLGTFEGTDGEMILLDGHVYQVRADGRCHEVPDATPSPFAVVTHFRADRGLDVDDCRDLDGLTARI